MKTVAREKMARDIRKHGEDLNRIFNTGLDPVELCKKLHRLELKAHRATTCLCNTNTLNLLELNQWTGYDVKQATEEEQNKFFDKIMTSVKKILGLKNDPNHATAQEAAIFINFDPRGYALKIKAEYVQRNNLDISRDLGGYGIIAPDFTPENYSNLWRVIRKRNI